MLHSKATPSSSSSVPPSLDDPRRRIFEALTCEKAVAVREEDGWWFGESAGELSSDIIVSLFNVDNAEVHAHEWLNFECISL